MAARPCDCGLYPCTDRVSAITEALVSLERFAAVAAIGAAFYLGYPKHRLGILMLLIRLVGFLEVAQNHVPGCQMV
jgi:hypothetical protein